MNKRGQERLSTPETIGVWFLVALGVVLLIYVYVDTGKSAQALTGQLPDDVASISGACKLAAESGQSILDGAYCTQAREVSYKGLLGFIGGSKAFVNCEYAKDNNWFTLDSTKVVNLPKCNNPDWAAGYCKYLKSVQGAKYKDTVVVNGETCATRNVPAEPKPVVADNPAPAK